MIWLAMVALGNMAVVVWLVRENRRLTQMAISKHAGEFASMIKAEKPTKKTNKKEDAYHTWRSPLEGVAP